MTKLFTKERFCSFPLKKQHKEAAAFLREYIQTRKEKVLALYKNTAKWMNLPPIQNTHEHLCNRHYEHCCAAEIFHKEHNLIPTPTKDSPSPVKPSSLYIYLDHIRSAHNIGSIIRTCEALRAGTLCFSESMCSINNPKLLKTSMGAHEHINIIENCKIEKLPRPWIAIETNGKENAFQFSYPQQGTLIFGNEEYGISDSILEEVDITVAIPLKGFKNSLNVSNAFSIIAGIISLQGELLQTNQE